MSSGRLMVTRFEYPDCAWGRVRCALRRAWLRVSEPRVVSLLFALIYVGLALGGVSALFDPPLTAPGAAGGFAMVTLAAMLVFGGVVGAPSALWGVWWLERVALLSVGLSAAIYGGVVAILHMTGEGNRLLQLSFIVGVLLVQLVRWHMIRVRPYDPNLVV